MRSTGRNATADSFAVRPTRLSKRADEVPPGYIRSFIPKDIEGKANLVYYHTCIINQEFSVAFQTRSGFCRPKFARSDA
jgi:hypothetical protein